MQPPWATTLPSNYGGGGRCDPSQGHHSLISEVGHQTHALTCHTWVRLIPSMSPSCEAAWVHGTTLGGARHHGIVMIWAASVRGCSASHYCDDLGHLSEGVLGITL